MNAIQRHNYALLNTLNLISLHFHKLHGSLFKRIGSALHKVDALRISTISENRFQPPHTLCSGLGVIHLWFVFRTNLYNRNSRFLNKPQLPYLLS